MGLYDDLAQRSTHIDLILGLVVEGVPYVFVERTLPASFSILTGRAQVTSVSAVREGEGRLDLDIRREVPATVEFSLLDNAGVLAGLLSVNRRRSTWITADATASATTLALESTSGMTAGDTIYIGSESITIGTVASATSLTGCTRGTLGSTAALLKGSATDGDAVYRTVPAWEGRRAWLYAWTVSASGVGLSQEILATLIIDGPPRHDGDNEWSIVCAGVMQEYMQRAVGVGLKSAKVTGPSVVDVTGDPTTITFPVDDATAFVIGDGPTWAILDTGHVLEVLSISLSPPKITVSGEIAHQDRGQLVKEKSGNADDASTLRPLAIAGGATAYPLLWSLISTVGSGTGFDALPGRVGADTYDAGWRFGAGIPAADIDTASFLARPAPSYNVLIDKERPVGEILQEWCYLSGSAIVTTSAGQLRAIPMSHPRSTSTVTIGADAIVPDTRIEVVADESTITPLVTVQCDYSPLTQEHRAEINLIDDDKIKRYPRSPRRREISLMSIGCSDARGVGAGDSWRASASMSAGEIATVVADIVSGESALARVTVSLTVTLDKLSVRLGDVVQIGSVLPSGFNAPDMAGGTISGSYARVIARRPDYDAGTVGLTLELLEALLHVCPAATIASIAGDTVTLATTGPEVSGTSPANDFFVGCGVRVHDRSASTFDTLTVIAIPSTTSLQLSAVPSFAIAGGTDYLVLSPLDGATSGTTVSGYTLAELSILAPANGVGTVFGTVNNTPRWR
jgi:hypothetical protein